jgi:hypothetical protein
MAKWFNLSKPCKDIFIWGFCGKRIPGIPLWACPRFNDIAEKQRYISLSFPIHFHAFHTRLWITSCGSGANSADFGMAYHAAQLAFILPLSVPILIVSGDRDLFHTMGHLLSSGRRTFMYDTRLKLAYIDGIHLQTNSKKKLQSSPQAFSFNRYGSTCICRNECRRHCHFYFFLHIHSLHNSQNKIT